MTDPYHTIPELDYVGSRSAASRLDGIEVMKPYCSGSSVLDLGCAEGLVSRELVRYGVRVVHGFDFDVQRLRIAERLFAGLGHTTNLCYAFRHEDFLDIVAFRKQWPTWREGIRTAPLAQREVPRTPAARRKSSTVILPTPRT